MLRHYLRALRRCRLRRFSFGLGQGLYLVIRQQFRLSILIVLLLQEAEIVIQGAAALQQGIEIAPAYGHGTHAVGQAKFC